MNVSALCENSCKVVDGTEVRVEPLTANERDVLLKRPFDLPARIHIAQITIKQYFDHHSGMEAAGPAPFVFFDNAGDVQIVNHFVYQPDRMVRRYPLQNILREKAWLSTC